ncbi:endonuclease V [Sulfolobus acidocaldarius]|uniref:Endonuclease V n=4 Tax=Sulfolobus acidocaldarius TaxID=2285 RepID=NFI_SULAC|nr:endonuclease V [Sulfolobus acidocaldarius]Q4JB89.1 RecName: Full=Endonuclease V; AltName: Full=Deoxyinosine 3'endonuclease; AltName: Full=Deoxyribonuclease V; Short=DNase V [Sulfolobus acidocaldarius DSM 639]AAY79940.1 endonuclease V [Sulfolobus acidocaldarius DSM 639]AGE70510.1 endonuclease V [Sulfolobus acidocaldarius N8]AGE72783.1 endonuclease V [Sulfolobus acidocaldarius Ron12/I]ALU29126.1 endonuclease V [Sulfolobus acidocaldarius]ALU31852.1 endonuclease V [Sulfolobus acidocaldarius]
MEDFMIEFLSKLQIFISKNITIKRLGIENIKNLCGVDIAYKGNIGYAVSVMFDGKDYFHKYVKGKVDFPYIPGYLFMREAPLMIKAVESFQCDLILVDGHGMAHPRKSGIASVIGVILDKPTIGVAKSKLYGDIVEEGSTNFIVVNGDKVGVKVGKYYYSIGNKVDIDDVVELSRNGYPKVLALADKLSKELKKKE